MCSLSTRVGILIVLTSLKGSNYGGILMSFDVSRLQVQAVLLLLGGYEIPSGIPAMGATPVGQRVWVQCHLFMVRLKIERSK